METDELELCADDVDRAVWRDVSEWFWVNSFHLFPADCRLQTQLLRGAERYANYPMAHFLRSPRGEVTADELLGCAFSQSLTYAETSLEVTARLLSLPTDRLLAEIAVWRLAQVGGDDG